jgi:hypothetical protein
MSEEYQIILFCIEYAKKNAFQPATAAKIADAAIWLEKMAALDYEINAKADANDEVI